MAAGGGREGQRSLRRLWLRPYSGYRKCHTLTPILQLKSSIWKRYM